MGNHSCAEILELRRIPPRNKGVLQVLPVGLHRDLKALGEAGYPVLTEVIDGTTYWKLEPSFKSVPPVTFTLNELMALYFSRKLFISPGGPPFKTDLESAFNKIESALPAKHIARLEKIEEMFTPLAKTSKKIDLNKGVFGIVQLALLNQNILKLEYKSRKGNRAYPFEVHPYSLLFYPPTQKTRPMAVDECEGNNPPKLRA